ncbi:hypothetical protein BB558_005105 [Smittium angustum]|uniref:Sphingomyelin synthase-like domain-containing protein n=1 Tax=Smittium angustum TaxID=133377 RepID=A0A2U1J1E7_SMIAN|nr:hypothetical protein BB558_005105 [Smittium angustum]
MKSKLKCLIKHRFLEEFFRLAVSFIFTVSISIFMAMCQLKSDQKYQNSVVKGRQDIPLEDVSFVYTTPIKGYVMADNSLNLSILIALVGIMFYLPNWRSRIVVFRRCMWMGGFIYVFRSITLSVTTLPPTLGSQCIRQDITGLNASQYFSIVFKLLGGELKSCTDNMFSGHASISTLCFMLWWTYCKNKLIVTYSAVHTIVTMYIILATRLHYTVDLLLAIIVTLCVHYIYFSSLEHHYRRNHLASCNSYPVRLSNTIETDISYNILPVSNNEVQYSQIGNQLNRSSEDFEKHGLQIENSDKLQCAVHNQHVLYNARSFSFGVLGSFIAWADGLDLREHEVRSALLCNK